mmetsp:Transcript_13361/g.27643  ORF Transcript_13361/g.27643 Transcript_13361/m.27643 type:complete len:221 (+) Transcript_13361:733-1395(+)
MQQEPRSRLSHGLANRRLQRGTTKEQGGDRKIVSRQGLQDQEPKPSQPEAAKYQISLQQEYHHVFDRNHPEHCIDIEYRLSSGSPTRKPSRHSGLCGSCPAWNAQVLCRLASGSIFARLEERPPPEEYPLQLQRGCHLRDGRWLGRGGCRRLRIQDRCDLPFSPREHGLTDDERLQAVRGDYPAQQVCREIIEQALPNQAPAFGYRLRQGKCHQAGDLYV